MQYINVGVGYKKKCDMPERSFPFLSGLLFKVDKQNNFSGGFSLNYNATVIEKKTNFYSNSDIDWISSGLEGGYDFTSSSEDIRFTPVLCANFGLYTFKPDTLIFAGLPVENKNTSVGWFQTGVKLYFIYKAFDLTAEYMGKGASDVFKEWLGGELSYTLWRENQEMDIYGRPQTYYQNNLKAYIRFDRQTLEIDKTNVNAASDILYRY